MPFDQPPSIDRLPDEVLLKVLECVRPKTLMVAVPGVCRRWRQLCYRVHLNLHLGFLSSTSLLRTRINNNTDFTIFIDVVKRWKRIKALRVHGWSLSRIQNLVMLHVMFVTFSTVKSVVLTFNNIGVEGGKTIGYTLKTNTTLTNLNLTYNDIGAEGAKAIADALKTNKSLTHLNLSANHIGDEGGRAIGDALKTNTTLAHLDLSGNCIGAEGVTAIGDALRTNTALTDLDLTYNDIDVETCKAIGDCPQVQHDTRGS